VVASPGSLRAAVPKAFVSPLGVGYTPCSQLAREIFLFTRRNLAPQKRIRRLEFSDLPKTISGMVRRAEGAHAAPQGL
jgi:acetyl-CoA synthetase